MEVNKHNINEEINKLNKDKEELNEEINKKKNLNKKIIIKSKNQLLNENHKLHQENADLRHENTRLKYVNEELESKRDYLLHYVKKSLDKVPKEIKDIVEIVFDRNMNVDLYKSQYDPEMLEKQQRRVEKYNRIFNTKEIEQSTKHINREMDKSAEEFYTHKKHNKNPLV